MQLVVTAEHASNHIPEPLGRLGLSEAVLESHVAWDPGSAELAKSIAKAFDAPLLAGEISRLVVDLNRSASGSRIAPASSFGVDIPGNRQLTLQQVQQRIETYWRPFRVRAAEQIRTAAAGGRRCLHLSVHTFTPRLGRELRDYDLAVLYDPRRDAERELASRMVGHWRTHGWAARRNAPYRGVADGHTTAMRKQLPDASYVGLEIEVNQRRLDDWPHVVAAVLDGLEVVLEKQKARL